METKPEKADVQEFNRRAATYENSANQGYFFDRGQRIVLNLAKDRKADAVLDVGCGTGRLLRKAKNLWPNARLIGVDAAEKMTEQAKMLFPQAEFHFAMAEALPLPDASVDLAFSTFSFHHWVDKAKGVSEIARVLHPGGRFLLADINAPFGLAVFVKRLKQNNPSIIRKFFVQAGLAVELQRRPWRWSRVLVVTVGKKSAAEG